MNKNKKNICVAGVVFVALGLGIAAVCIFPSEWMVGIAAAALVVAGVILMKR